MTTRRSNVIPGLPLTLGFTLAYLGLVVLLPLSAALARSASLSWPEFWGAVTNPRVLASYRLTFGAALAAALVNACFGSIVAWVLVRYDFPGRRLVDAAVDLPFALPTAVAGIALTSVYAETGWLGQTLKPLGIKVAFTPLGVTVALIFIGLPFVVRTVQPVLEDLDHEVEEAAASLGATRRQTVTRVLLPMLAPAKVLLLDEPFGALDAKVRKELRSWLRRLHDELHVTSVFVTHDVEEALEVSDLVAIMNNGEIQQLGTPAAVCATPANAFVADFIGSEQRHDAPA